MPKVTQLCEIGLAFRSLSIQGPYDNLIQSQPWFEGPPGNQGLPARAPGIWGSWTASQPVVNIPLTQGFPVDTLNVPSVLGWLVIFSAPGNRVLNWSPLSRRVSVCSPQFKKSVMSKASFWCRGSEYVNPRTSVGREQGLHGAQVAC